MEEGGLGVSDSSNPQAWSSNQYARWLTVTCWRKRDERAGGAVWFGSLASLQIHPRPPVPRVKRVLTSSPCGTCLAWLPIFCYLLPSTAYAYRTIYSGNPLGPQSYSNNAIYGRLLPGRLPFLQHRQCLPGRDISSTSEPRPRPRLTSGSCHPLDAACNGFS